MADIYGFTAKTIVLARFAPPPVALRARGSPEHRERARRSSARRPCGCEGLRVGEGRTTIAREPEDNP
jgi:hypothetical protein